MKLWTSLTLQTHPPNTPRFHSLDLSSKSIFRRSHQVKHLLCVRSGITTSKEDHVKKNFRIKKAGNTDVRSKEVRGQLWPLRHSLNLLVVLTRWVFLAFNLSDSSCCRLAFPTQTSSGLTLSLIVSYLFPHLRGRRLSEFNQNMKLYS